MLKMMELDFRRYPITTSNYHTGQDCDGRGDIQVPKDHYLHGKPMLTVPPKRFSREYTSRDISASNLLQELLTQIYTATTESVRTTSITVWFGSAASNELKRLQCIFRSAEKLIGSNLPSHKDLFFSRARKLVEKKYY